MEDNTYHILSIFALKFSPATEATYTDQFTSKEIKMMVDDHLGQDTALEAIHNTMRDLQYIYIMRDQEFVWLVQKD